MTCLVAITKWTKVAIFESKEFLFDQNKQSSKKENSSKSRSEISDNDLWILVTVCVYQVHQYRTYDRSLFRTNYGI